MGRMGGGGERRNRRIAEARSEWMQRLTDEHWTIRKREGGRRGMKANRLAKSKVRSLLLLLNATNGEDTVLVYQYPRERNTTRPSSF